MIRVYKNTHSNKAPTIELSQQLQQQELIHPDLIENARDLFTQNGVLVVKNLFSQDAIAIFYRAFIEGYQSYFEEREYANALKVGDKRIMLTIDFQEPFNNPDLYGNLFLLYLIRELLGEEFVLGSFGVVISLPGAEDQHIHRDHPPLFEDEELDLKIPSFAIAVVVPFIDLTPETGSTRVWKGSHRMPHSRYLALKDSFVPFVETGSCYLMDYQLLHGGTPNISDRVRPILYMVYYRSWFQEAVNYEKQATIAIAKEEYLKIPEKYKFLFIRCRDFLDLNDSREKCDRLSEDIEKEQNKQLEKLAKIALLKYGIKHANLKLISRSENIIFSVNQPDYSLEKESDSLYQTNRFLLRIHRTNYLSRNEIESELTWLTFLYREAKLPIPEPIPNREEKFATLARIPDISELHICSMTRWMKGQFLSGNNSSKLELSDLELIGCLLGQLHYHAEHWSIPKNFTRPCWNWDGLFGKRAGYSKNGYAIWDLVPQQYRSLFEMASHKIKKMMLSLGEKKEQFGLIHGDFWLGNLLVFENEIRPIDFADCGFGYWGYDLARFLSDFTNDPNFSIYLDRLLSGYTQIREFPEEQFLNFHVLIVTQQLALTLWRINRSQDSNSFRSTLEEDCRETATIIEEFL